MAEINDHNRLIAAAAKAALSPLGCQRKGRSRLWFSDERFWLVVVEFQPSGWSKGSYLNIGAKWLWRSHPGYSVFNRVADFIPFENVEQFEPAITAMAEQAAREVIAIRDRFKSLEDVRQYLASRLERDSWRLYEAAIVAGLAGDIETARSLLLRFEAWATSFQWSTALITETSTLLRLLGNEAAFHDALLMIIQRSRIRYGLHPDRDCLNHPTSKVER